MITDQNRTDLNRLLAQVIANANCGNHAKAHAKKHELVDMLHALVPHPAAVA